VAQNRPIQRTMWNGLSRHEKKVTHSPLKLTTKRSREGVRIPAKKMGPSPRRVSVSSVDGTPLDLSGMAVERPSVVDGITREAEWMRTTIRSRQNHGHHPPWETSNHPMKERHLCLEVLALHAVLVLDGELPALRLGTRRAWESRAGTGEQLLWGPDQWDTRDRRIPIQKKDIHHTAILMSIVMVIPYAPPSG